MRKQLVTAVIAVAIAFGTSGCAAFGIYPTATSDDFSKITDEALFLQLTDEYAVGSGNPCTTLADLIEKAPADENSAALLYSKYSTLASTFKLVNPDLSNFLYVLADFADPNSKVELTAAEKAERSDLEARLSKFCTTAPTK